MLVLLVAFAEARSESRHGLVIGVGEYLDARWGKIHGDRDVPIVKQMLGQCGYDDIVTLTNQEATKGAIIAAFGNLCARCGQGDTVYVHFSGHGQLVTDVDGDEEDGWDEAWVPYDAMFAYSSTYKGEHHLIDDEIAVWMNRVKNKIGPSGRLLVVVDACHSGDSTREAIDGDEDMVVRGTDTDFIIPLRSLPARRPAAKETWLTLTACRDYQINCEIKTVNGKYYGMLSYVLCREHARMAGLDNDNVTMRLQQLVDKYRHRLPQDITLSGEVDSHSLSVFFK